MLIIITSVPTCSNVSLFNKFARARDLSHSLCVRRPGESVFLLQNELKQTRESLVYLFVLYCTHTSITTLEARGEYNNQSSIITLIKCGFALPLPSFPTPLAICEASVPHFYGSTHLSLSICYAPSTVCGHIQLLLLSTIISTHLVLVWRC